MKRGIVRYLTLSVMLTGLWSCGTVTEQKDGAPRVKPDVANIPDAVPRDEPRSKYGNPASYEVFGKRYYTLASSDGYVERGKASWYGTKFHGRRTSSGEPYDMYAMTAAHKTLPLPSYAEVTNLDNGRKVVVKINDRGPFHDDRLIDLSYSAATKLGIVAKGTGNVEVRAITQRNVTASANNASPQTVAKAIPAANTVAAPTSTMGKVVLFLQVGAFSTMSRAEQIKQQVQQQIEERVHISTVERSQSPLYRVRVGPFESAEYGERIASRLMDLGFSETRIVTE
ncbi:MULTISPECIES: septal ring lytic transglycosylase RlpA family protein [Methylophaga]|uniref:Endolytic peptidoglycan transglycosylase RlpA n=1 Tax=Methylophaga muralis TaxID=291169 RepID=A0A1E3GTD9_9GAMM|nr:MULTISPECIES: septal ring lytic transglycosylase RlpA family protein [Methylophaga]ODN67320.1 RlpA-like protein precursor [Methylophaga muralis]THK42526.1 septal ring lytic transglycosylase RlpA family protein [Methylophaga sp. SB9B]